MISDLRIMPLKEAGVLEMFPDADLTFELGDDLDDYEFDINDSVENIYSKYFNVHNNVEPNIRNHIWSVIDKEAPKG